VEYRKYLLRFGLVMIIAMPILLFMAGPNELRVISYKVSLLAIAVALAEIIWMGFFKPYYGKTEEMSIVERKDILIFRGILYAAIILALTLGL